MSAPRLLDLFARAQGTSVGYARAGFQVTASDIDSYPRHPEVAEFFTADALEVLDDVAFCRTFDMIAASPVCKGYSNLRFRHQGVEYPQQIAPVLEKLERIGRPYVLENVESKAVREAYVREPVRLCGSMFGLGATCRDGNYRQLRRHRLFLPGGWKFTAPGPCAHGTLTGGVYGTGGGGPQTRGYRFNWGSIGVYGHGSNGVNGKGYAGNKGEAAEAMGIDWMRRDDLSQAIPPAYTKHIGEEAMFWV